MKCHRVLEALQLARVLVVVVGALLLLATHQRVEARVHGLLGRLDLRTRERKREKPNGGTERKK